MAALSASIGTVNARAFRTAPRRAALPSFTTQRSSVVVRASDDADAALEKRLEKLRLAKGATPYGQGSKAEKANEKANKGMPIKAPTKGTDGKMTYDYSEEKLYYEGGPPTADLILNLVLGTTLLWLPLTFAAIGRCAFLKYRFTDKRFSIVSNAPWQISQTDVAYQEVKDVVTVSRLAGAWGDMVIELRDGNKVEIRSIEKFKEIRDYVLTRRDAMRPSSLLDVDDLLGEVAPKAKGFAQ